MVNGIRSRKKAIANHFRSFPGESFPAKVKLKENQITASTGACPTQAMLLRPVGTDVRQVTPDRQPITVRKSANEEKGKIRIATWNVRTLAQRGKIENLIKETKRMNINVMGVTEMRWKDQGHITNNGYKVLWSGGQKLEHGVGFVLDPLAFKAFKGYLAVSDRIILLKMKGPQRDLNIIKVYAPTEAAQNEEIDEFYGKLEETRRKCKTNEILVVMEDLNAKVEKNRDGNTVGPFGLGVRNERGDLWVDWCRNNKLMITNT